MPTVKRLIAKQTLLENSTSVVFSNIPQIYTDLLICCSARSNGTLDFGNFTLAFNGSTSNFTMRRMFGTGSSAVSDSLVAVGATNQSGTSTANTFASNEIRISNYAGSTAKPFMVIFAQENTGTQAYPGMNAGLWSDTSAITSITLGPPTQNSATTFLAGSTFSLYGIAQVPVIVGGTETISGGYKIHTFTSTSSLRVLEAGQVEYLVVAGGGGGGPTDITTGTNGNHSGGGGAGGYRSSVPGESSGGGSLAEAKLGMSLGNFTITVGGGGSGSAANSTNGNDSSISSIVVSTGGGRGGGLNTVPSWFSGGTGGSGGGGGEGSGNGSGTTGQGFAGGAAGGTQGSGGGGGGASAAGSVGTVSAGGNGGAGLGSAISGSFTHRAGGGGGSGPTTAGVGGLGGGGSAGGSTIGIQGLANTGGGGGSGNRDGGNGGSGIVIIRYPYIGN